MILDEQSDQTRDDYLGDDDGDDCQSPRMRVRALVLVKVISEFGDQG